MNLHQNFSIDGRFVGEGRPCYIIAEAGSNHDGNIEQAFALIDAAKEARADAVKFQVFTAGKIAARTTHPSGTIKNKFNRFGATMYDLYRKAELPKRWLPRLFAHAKRRGITFMATPFDESALDLLVRMKMPAVKIASFELVHLPLLRRAARTGLPVLLSTGAGRLSEVEDAMDALEGSGARKIALFHCGIEYPLPAKDAHLAAMKTLATAFCCPVGYSDHTLGIAVPTAAVVLGAKFIEKHYTVSRGLAGPDHAFALEPRELKAMVASIREAESAVGLSRKRERPVEAPYRRQGRRSLFAKDRIKKGQKITMAMLAVLRPGSGLMPKYLDVIVGRRAARDIPSQHPLSWDDLCPR